MPPFTFTGQLLNECCGISRFCCWHPASSQQPTDTTYPPAPPIKKRQQPDTGDTTTVTCASVLILVLADHEQPPLQRGRQLWRGRRRRCGKRQEGQGDQVEESLCRLIEHRVIKPLSLLWQRSPAERAGQQVLLRLRPEGPHLRQHDRGHLRLHKVLGNAVRWAQDRTICCHVY